MSQKTGWTPYRGRARIVYALAASNAVSVFLLLARLIEAGNVRYYFLLWNMFLALVPLALALLLVRLLRRKSWLSWQGLLISAGWLLFLPNSFYLVTDLIHLHQTYEVNILYDATLFASFILNGFLVGIMSLVIVHKLLLRRVRRRDAHAVIAGVILASSFAVYLGRFMRWNSWDIFLHPAGVLFDASSQLITIASPSAFATTVSFFLLIGSSYIVAWNLVSYLREGK